MATIKELKDEVYRVFAATEEDEPRVAWDVDEQILYIYDAEGTEKIRLSGFKRSQAVEAAMNAVSTLPDAKRKRRKG